LHIVFETYTRLTAMYTKRGVGKSYARSKMALLAWWRCWTTARAALLRSLFLQTSVLTPSLPQVVELGFAHVCAPRDLDLFQAWRVE